MKYELRPYQKAASDAAVKFFLDETKKNNAIIVLPTGAGKSVCVAEIAFRLNANVLIFCPNREITLQNYEKMKSYGVPCSCYSASVGEKIVSQITFCTIGSVIRCMEKFKDTKYMIVDECHQCNPREGQYKKFFSTIKRKVLGLTATPYRLSTSRDFGAMLKFITRTRPCIFSEVIYHVQVSDLLDMGFLAKLRYFPMNPKGWNDANLMVNSNGSDYTDKSVQSEYERINFYDYLVHTVDRVVNNRKTGIKRKGILVFTRFLKEAEMLTRSIPGCAIVSGDTPKAERERILEAFKSGEIKVVSNVGVLTTGFDYPELDTVIMARPTMSLALWYQIVGRILRPHPDKESGWVIDLAGNIKRFGEVADLKLKRQWKRQVGDVLKG